MTVRRRPTLAIDVLRELVARGPVGVGTIARELAVPRTMVEAWLANERPMPVERQLALAMLVIDRAPALRRLGYRLLGHVQATLLYHARMTKTHLTAPVPRFKPPGRLVDTGLMG